jgi:hypothetical protein
VEGHAKKVLGLSSRATIPARQPFNEIGLDSLMAVEARNRIRGDFPELSLGTTLCFDYPTVATLTDYLLKALALEVPTKAPGPPAGGKRVEDLSEVEAEALLLEELEGRRS